jgi:hypothetical protein
MNPAKRGKIINATDHFAILADIKNFLVEMQRKGERGLLSEIEKYNRTFHERKSFTVENYVRLINETYGDAVANHRTGMDYAKDARFGLGMPPNAVAKYLEVVWGLDTTVFFPTDRFPDPGGDAIIGVRKPADDRLKLYRGLCHWMYRFDGKIYSWGQQFNTVFEAGMLGRGGVVYEVVCLIYMRSH